MAFIEVAGGALLGGAISLASTVFVEERRARRERERERERHAHDLRRSARLVADELRRTSAVLSATLSVDAARWPPVEGYALSMSVWHAQQEIVAGCDDAVWKAVTEAYAAVDSLSTTLTAGVPRAPSENLIVILHSTNRLLESATAALDAI